VARPKTDADLPRPFGKYELLERIGDGGMAEVFRARLPGAAGFEKIVVIKRILPHLARKKQVVEMFLAEARLTAQVQHKNIVQVFELGEEEENGQYFMVLEYIRGTDLRRLIRSATKRRLRIPPWFAMHVMIEVLDGLAYAHELTDDDGRPRNIIHRDVSPSNIFISHLGETKLGDFGIAKEKEQSELTKTGQLKGKVAYMAPEQLLGDPMDQRADVFSAGVVLWECLAQRRLFGGRPDLGAMKMIVTGERPTPSSIMRDVPSALDECVLAALEVTTDKRTQNARDMQSQLLEIMHSVHPITKPKEIRLAVDALLGKVKSDAPEFRAEIGSFSQDFETGSVEGTPSIPSKDLPSDGGSNDTKVQPTDLDLSFEHGHDSRDRLMPVQADQPPFAFPRDDTVTEVADTYVKSEKEAAASGGPKSSPKISFADDPEDPRNWLVASHEVHEQASARVMEMAQKQWASYGLDGQTYSGPHPFWLRDIAGKKIGPLSCDQAQGLIRKEAHLRLSANARISADDLSWTDLNTFTRLTGQEGLLYDENARLPVEGDFVGFLDERNMAWLSGLLTRERLTGRLMVSPEGLRKSIYREVHVIKGAPIYVFANEDALQLPELLAQRQMIRRERIAEAVHTSLAGNRPLEELAAGYAPTQVSSPITPAKLRALWMKDRLIDMYTWTAGRFVFAAVQTEQATPFARSLFSLVPELIHRGFSHELLRSFSLAYMDVRFKGTPKLESEMDELGFSATQKDIAQKLASGKKLSVLIKMRPTEERVHLLVAYVLIETELLVRA
jgi:serine/threonine-protein kinase